MDTFLERLGHLSGRPNQIELLVILKTSPSVMESKLDSLIQKIASQKRSQISLRPNCVGHHLLRRVNKLYRWDLGNILFCTVDEHRLIHAKPEYEKSILSKKQKDFLRLHREDSYQEYLVNNGLSEEEFLQIKFNELKKHVR